MTSYKTHALTYPPTFSLSLLLLLLLLQPPPPPLLLLLLLLLPDPLGSDARVWYYLVCGVRVSTTIGQMV